MFEHRNAGELASTSDGAGTIPSASTNPDPDPDSDSDMSCWHLDVQALGEEQLRQGNPIGAGDTVAAVLLAKYLCGHTMLDAFRWGIAAGSAKCMLPGSGGEYRDEDLHAWATEMFGEEAYRPPPGKAKGVSLVH